MRYHELKEKQQKEFDSFPIMFAYNAKQFEEGCQKFNVKTSEAKEKFYSIGAGGYILKTDSEKFDNMLRRFDSELKEALKDPVFAEDAFTYELENHEFCITGNPADALAVFTLSIKEVMQDPMLKECLSKAIKTASQVPA